MNRTEKVIMNREMNSIMIKMISEFTKQTQDNKTFWTFIDKSANGTLIFETYILGYYYQISQYRSGFSESLLPSIRPRRIVQWSESRICS